MQPRTKVVKETTILFKEKALVIFPHESFRKLNMQKIHFKDFIHENNRDKQISFLNKMNHPFASLTLMNN